MLDDPVMHFVLHTVFNVSVQLPFSQYYTLIFCQNKEKNKFILTLIYSSLLMQFRSNCFALLCNYK